EILAILTALQRNFQINETLLKDSQGSLTVGRLRYHVSPSISSLAKEIVKDWKAPRCSRKNEGQTIWARDQAPTAIVGITAASQKHTSEQGGKLRSSAVYSGLTGDKTRNTCIEMLYDTLTFDSGARKLLQAVSLFSSTHRSQLSNLSFARRQKSRQHVMVPTSRQPKQVFRYLQDEDNSALREEVASGDLPVERFLQMADCGYLGPSE
ncbi:hypothetical protein B0H14DRAFT_2392111, partial [Mycena olivaceomarginata]